MKLSATGLSLIKSFEGLDLVGIQRKGDVPTIGYGHTGPDVKVGEAITKAEAEALLTADLARFEAQVNSSVKVKLTQDQYDALVSWNYNTGALSGHSTLLDKLNAGDYQGAADQFLVWDKVDDGEGNLVESAGLLDRRRKERALFLFGTTAPSMPANGRLPLFFPAADSSQSYALTTPQEGDLLAWLAKRGGGKYTVRQDLEKAFLDLPSSPPKPVPPPKPAQPAKPPSAAVVGFPVGDPPPAGGTPLWIPGVLSFSQRDSKVVKNGENQADRSCFSSACSMLLEFLRPGTLSGPNGDDTYLAWLEANAGDTTDPSAQVAAMYHFGLSVRERTDMSWIDLETEVKAGRPVPIPIQHHGPPSAAYGWHWIVVLGYNDQYLLVNDPYGELDNAAGGYPDPSSSGQHLWYSRKNLGPRWLVGGAGWGMVVRTQ